MTAEPPCIATLCDGVCILTLPCTVGCRLRSEAWRGNPFAHRPLTDEERERYRGERDEERDRAREAARQLMGEPWE